MSAIQALQRFTKEVKKFPFPHSFEPVRKKWEELSQKGFLDPEQPWLSAFQLANFTKFLVIYGVERPRRTQFDLARPFNRYKDFWSAVELENRYSTDPEFVAAFIFRFLYQQLPYFLYRSRVPFMFDATRALYLSSCAQTTARMTWSMSDFEKETRLPLDAFLRVSQKICLFLQTRMRVDKESLENCLDEKDRTYFDSVLNLLSATRRSFREAYDGLKADDFHEIPYEFNPLLRFPIIAHGSEYWAPIPELIAYAATKGLYFYLIDTFGGPFQKWFAEIFSGYAGNLFIKHLGKSVVLTETDERSHGWQGKTNDFTLIIGSNAFLFECKTSALFFDSKKESSVETIAKDIRKNLANPKHRSGLFQLYDKIEAIKNKKLPKSLNAHYENVREFFPVLLIHDRIEYANHPQTFRNLLDAELRAAGIQGFKYQVWHLEEIENLFEIIPPTSIGPALEEKFLNPSYEPWDLNTYLYEKTGRRFSHLRLFFFVPKGETEALKIIRSLADKK
jgi:hypothetical protein